MQHYAVIKMYIFEDCLRGKMFILCKENVKLGMYNITSLKKE